MGLSQFTAKDILGFTVVGALADPYFRRYRLVSSIYRLCSLLGWIELYRQDLVFLEARETKASENLDRAIYAIRGDLADGRLNAAPDWEDWRDALLFREEQRAVGESMIVTVGEIRVVMGYAQFSEPFPNAKESSQSHWIEVANLAAYSAASAGVIAFTKALSRETCDTSIRINCVAPGPIDTDLIRRLGDKVVDDLIAASPLKRLGNADEVAAIVLWLCSASSAFNTGAVFDMSGGRARY
jgi:hypothetical protein